MMKGAEPIFINKKSSIGVLMLHGFTSTPAEFKEMSEFLSGKGFTVYAPLLAGHGTYPDDLMGTTPEDWKKSAKQAYLDLKKNCKKVLIVGNSFGSNLGFWLAKELDNEPMGIVTLDAPIFPKYYILAILRLNTYGLFKKYYKKSRRIYKTDYIDGADDITYSVIPVKSLREFLRFLRQETVPSLPAVKIPVLITHSKTDPVIDPKSATYIYNNIGSTNKSLHWFVGEYHGFTVDGRRTEVFQKIFEFMQELLPK